MDGRYKTNNNKTRQKIEFDRKTIGDILNKNKQQQQLYDIVRQTSLLVLNHKK